MHKLMLTYLLCVAAFCARGQDSASLAYTDAFTYDLFIQKDWRQLITVGNDAVKQKEDFYFLRVRMGIAHYELEEYRLALHHFEKAWQMNQEHEALKEYLYYCYMYSEQYPQALKMSKHFAKETAEKTSMSKPSPVHFANVEYGMKVASVDSLYEPLHYFQAGIGWRMGRNVTAYAAFTNITQQSYYGTLGQQQFYLSAAIPFAGSWLFSPAAHYMVYEVTGPNLVQPSPPPGAPEAPPVVLFNGNPFVTSVLVSNQYRDLGFSFEAAYSTLAKAQQFQQGVEVKWFPLHNNALALSTSIQLLSNDSGLLFHPLTVFGLRSFISPRLSFSASYAIINAKNFSESNAYLVNNSYDLTHHRFSTTLDWNCYKKISVYGTYLFESKTESYYNAPYNYNMFIGGVKMYF